MPNRDAGVAFRRSNVADLMSGSADERLSEFVVRNGSIICCAHSRRFAVDGPEYAIYPEIDVSDILF